MARRYSVYEAADLLDQLSDSDGDLSDGSDLDEEHLNAEQSSAR